MVALATRLAGKLLRVSLLTAICWLPTGFGPVVGRSQQVPVEILAEWFLEAGSAESARLTLSYVQMTSSPVFAADGSSSIAAIGPQTTLQLYLLYQGAANMSASGSLVVVRSPTQSGGEVQPTLQVAADTEVTLQAGDYALVPAGVVVFVTGFGERLPLILTVSWAGSPVTLVQPPVPDDPGLPPVAADETTSSDPGSPLPPPMPPDTDTLPPLPPVGGDADPGLPPLPPGGDGDPGLPPQPGGDSNLGPPPPLPPGGDGDLDLPPQSGGDGNLGPPPPLPPGIPGGGSVLGVPPPDGSANSSFPRLADGDVAGISGPVRLTLAKATIAPGVTQDLLGDRGPVAVYVLTGELNVETESGTVEATFSPPPNELTPSSSIVTETLRAGEPASIPYGSSLFLQPGAEVTCTASDGGSTEILVLSVVPS